MNQPRSLNGFKTSLTNNQTKKNENTLRAKTARSTTVTTKNAAPRGDAILHGLMKMDTTSVIASAKKWCTLLETTRVIWHSGAMIYAETLTAASSALRVYPS